MNKIESRIADLYLLVEFCKNKRLEGSDVSLEDYAFKCQLDMLVEDLKDFHLIEKCKCCCDD